MSERKKKDRETGRKREKKQTQTSEHGTKTAQLIPIYPRHDAWDFDSIISFCTLVYYRYVVVEECNDDERVRRRQEPRRREVFCIAAPVAGYLFFVASRSSSWRHRSIIHRLQSRFFFKGSMNGVVRSIDY